MDITTRFGGKVTRIAGWVRDTARTAHGDKIEEARFFLCTVEYDGKAEEPKWYHDAELRGNHDVLDRYEESHEAYEEA